MISYRDIIGILAAAMLVFAAGVAIAQKHKSATGSSPNQFGQGQGALIPAEKQTTACLSRALQDLDAKGWRGDAVIVELMDLCPYPGLPVTVDDYAQLVHAQVARSPLSE